MKKKHQVVKSKSKPESSNKSLDSFVGVPKLNSMSKSEKDLHHLAAQIVEKFNLKQSSIKTLIYSSNHKNIRQLFALVNECVKYQCLMREVLSRCPKSFLEEEILSQGPRELRVVLMYEFLLGKQFQGKRNFQAHFDQYRDAIEKAVEQTLAHHGVNTLQEALQAANTDHVDIIPRYIRVNLIKSSVENAVDELQREGWTFIGTLDGHSFTEAVATMTPDQFGLDPFLPDLLVFPSGTDFHSHYMTGAGVLVQQDRASCVPAHVLNPSSKDVVLDCCAAPGNKTTHLASLMGDEGRVIAMDRDAQRMETMARLVQRSGASCIQLVHQDFLTVHPDSEDASDVRKILVDPSCSGSGMVRNRPSHQDEPLDKKRLQSLKHFQISILKHALRFPSVNKVVYSTCSVHQEENEEVVTEVMAQVADYFRFEKVLPEWSTGSRGLDSFPDADCFLRLSPKSDLTQGFFVACFKRIKQRGDCQTEVETELDGAENTGFTDSDVKQRNKQKKRKMESVEESIDNEKPSGSKKKRKNKATADLVRNDFSNNELDIINTTPLKKRMKKKKVDVSVKKAETETGKSKSCEKSEGANANNDNITGTKIKNKKSKKKGKGREN